MRVLVVDDEVEMAALLARGLVGEGYDVETRIGRHPGHHPGRRAAVRPGRARRDHAGHVGVRTLQAPARSGAGHRHHPADGTRRGRRPGQGAGCRRRRLSDEAVRLRRTRGAASGAAAPRGARPDRTRDRRNGHRPGRPADLGRRPRGTAQPHRVRPAAPAGNAPRRGAASRRHPRDHLGLRQLTSTRTSSTST